MNAALQTFRDAYYRTQVRLRPCVCCRGNAFTLITTQNRHPIALPTSICRHCGLVQVNPIASEDWYASFYRDYFWDVYINRQLGPDEFFEQDECAYKGQALASVLIPEAAMLDHSPLHWLDIGCGLGGLLAELHRQQPAWRVSAIEPSQSARAYVEAKTGIVPVAGNYTSLPFDDGSVSVITLVHVLEHVYEPLGLLREIRRVLSDDGFCYIEVPDLDSPHWHGKGFLHIAHTFQFDSRSLIALLQCAGMQCYRQIPSPAVRTWSWASGYFIRKAAAQIPPVQLSTELITTRVDRLRKRLQKPAPTRKQQLQRLLGPGLPGPKTLLRILRGWF